jgi:hypothetical protein
MKSPCSQVQAYSCEIAEKLKLLRFNYCDSSSQTMTRMSAVVTLSMLQSILIQAHQASKDKI